MYQQLSPNMLKTFEECPRKFDFKYLQDVQMPVNDDIFEFGKNIHALASYYLRGEFIDKLEKSLSPKETEIWNYLRECKYFAYDVVNTEYNLAVKIGKYFFGGRLDALVKNGGKYYILDYKTGSAPKNPCFDFQTIIYTLCVKEFFKTDNVTFVYLDLKHREEVVIPFSPDIEETYRQKLLEISNKIDAYESVPKRRECVKTDNLYPDNLNTEPKPLNRSKNIYPCEYSIICY